MRVSSWNGFATRMKDYMFDARNWISHLAHAILCPNMAHRIQKNTLRDLFVESFSLHTWANQVSENAAMTTWKVTQGVSASPCRGLSMAPSAYDSGM
jgi:hypothetical protein